MRIAVIGIGHEQRGEAAARPLVRQGGGREEVSPSGGEVAALMEAWRGYDLVILVDAAESGIHSGSVRVLEAIPALAGGVSSDKWDISAALELARLLDRLPRRLTSETSGESSSYGMVVSPRDAAGVAAAAALIRQLQSPPEEL